MKDDLLGAGGVELGLAQVHAIGLEIEGEDGEVLVGLEAPRLLRRHGLRHEVVDVLGRVKLGLALLGRGRRVERQGRLADDRGSLVATLAVVAVAAGAVQGVELLALLELCIICTGKNGREENEAESEETTTHRDLLFWNGESRRG